MTSQGCCAIIQTKLVTIAAASTFTRMKGLVATLPFFLACLLLEMRNALLANGLKEFSRGELTDSWELLPVSSEASHSGAKKQTASNTEDTTYYVADQFNGMVSRSNNPRQFLQESKASFLCLLDPFVLLGRFGRFAAHSGAKKQTARGLEPVSRKS